MAARSGLFETHGRRRCGGCGSGDRRRRVRSRQQLAIELAGVWWHQCRRAVDCRCLWSERREGEVRKQSVSPYRRSVRHHIGQRWWLRYLSVQCRARLRRSHGMGNSERYKGLPGKKAARPHLRRAVLRARGPFFTAFAFLRLCSWPSCCSAPSTRKNVPRSSLFLRSNPLRTMRQSLF